MFALSRKPTARAAGSSSILPRSRTLAPTSPRWSELGVCKGFVPALYGGFESLPLRS